MRPQVNLLQKQFKAAAATTATTAAAATANASKLLPRSLGTTSANGSLNTSGGRNVAASNDFVVGMSCWLRHQHQLQQFHSTAVAQKDEEGGSNNNSKKGSSGSNKEVEANKEAKGFELVDETLTGEEADNASDIPAIKSVRSQGLPKCAKCGRPLRNLRNTVNVNNNLLECTECGVFYARRSGGGTADASYQSLMRQLQQVSRLPTPKEITAYLNNFVIGQDEAKKALSLGVYEHYIRVVSNERLQPGLSSLSSAASAESQTATAYHQSLMSRHPNIAQMQSSFSPDVMLRFQGAASARAFAQNVSAKKKAPYAGSFINLGLLSDENQVRLDKSNIMLLGPSGVGKTYIVKVLARVLDVPLAHCDCTSMTQAGYVGEDVESVLQKLLQEADGDVQRAQRGIVFLDEVDKIAATRESASHAYRDVSGEGVQHAMLKMVEGAVMNVKNGRKGQQETVAMDTADILFIASGAFTGLEKLIGRRLEKHMLGFGANPPVNTITKDDDQELELAIEKRDRLLKQVQPEDLTKFGIIPELVGRFPIRVAFSSLDKESLKRVMTEPKNSMLVQEQTYFRMHGAKLEITDDALDEMAQMALKGRVGARALMSILYKVLWEAKYNLPGADYDKVRITGEAVRGDAPAYEVTYKEGALASASESCSSEQQRHNNPSSSHHKQQQQVMTTSAFAV